MLSAGKSVLRFRFREELRILDGNSSLSICVIQIFVKFSYAVRIVPRHIRGQQFLEDKKQITIIIIFIAFILCHLCLVHIVRRNSLYDRTGDKAGSPHHLDLYLPGRVSL